MIKSENVWEATQTIWAEAFRLTQLAWVEALIYMVLTISIWSLFDLGVLSDDLSIMATITDFLLAYFLTVGLIKKGGLAPSGLKGTIGSYFLISLISGIAILLGIFLLIIPGIILSVRWSPVFGIALVDGAEGTDALTQAWEKTQSVFWPLLLAVLLPALIAFVPAIGLIVYDVTSIFGTGVGLDMMGSSSLVLLLITALSSVSVLILTAIGIASYSLLRDDTASLNEVFE